MISYGESIVYGILQGLTEFIPVSSTAHVRIGSSLMGRSDPGAAYSAVIQLGTLFSLLVYFRKDLWEFTEAALRGLFTGKPFAEPAARTAWFLVLGTIPVGVVGLLLSDFIEGDARSLYVVGVSLIVMALLLWVSDLFSKRVRDVKSATWLDYLAIGFAQCLALIPGSSRSGSTLMMGLFLHFKRESAMRISFLLSIPAIGASGLYELVKEYAQLAEQGLGSLIVGTLTAAVVGYLTIAFLLRYLRTHSTLVFVLYRIALGLLVLYLVYSGFLKPL